MMLRVAFPTDGVYRFKLFDRGDYFTNIKTIGPDNMPPSPSPSDRNGDLVEAKEVRRA
jgi:hypothetical protein